MNKLYDRMYAIDNLSLTGRRDTHVEYVKELGVYLYPRITKSVLDMRDQALKYDIKIGIRAGFRSFDHQLSIWNSKLLGHKPLLDDEGRLVNINDYKLEERIDFLLNWVNVPALSRHHWGTDIDIFDLNSVLDQSFILLPNDFSENGKFNRLYEWMDQNANKYGFFMPYKEYHGLLRPEPWHWSHQEISGKFQEKLNYDIVSDSVTNANIIGKDYILGKLEMLFLITKNTV